MPVGTRTDRIALSSRVRYFAASQIPTTIRSRAKSHQALAKMKLKKMPSFPIIKPKKMPSFPTMKPKKMASAAKRKATIWRIQPSTVKIIYKAHATNCKIAVPTMRNTKPELIKSKRRCLRDSNASDTRYADKARTRLEYKLLKIVICVLGDVPKRPAVIYFAGATLSRTHDQPRLLPNLVKPLEKLKVM